MESHVDSMTGHATTGQPIYKRFCIGCHGPLGDGQGENAQWIDPKPRNFTIAIFRCRSTPTGTLPTDTDLYDTIGRGMLNSNMPHWLPLTDQDRVDLVAYVKHFSPRWVTEKAGYADRHPARARGDGRQDQRRPGSVPEAGVLEVPWRNWSGQRPFGGHSGGRRKSSDQAIQLPRLAETSNADRAIRRCIRTS